MNFPKLSVIIPSLNQGKYIERSILSILKQEYKGELEIIVSDGGSNDSTVDILKKYPQIIWWSETDRGFADAVNKALRVATGEIISIQSSDDYYLSNAFNISVGFLLENPDYAFVTANDVYLYNSNGKLRYERSRIHGHHIDSRNFLVYKNIPQHCTFVRRKATDRVGGVVSLTSGKVDYYSDAYLWYRILHFYKARFLPVYTGVYQYHHDQRATQKSMERHYIFKKMIETCENNNDFSSRFRLKFVEKK